mmetsp:Transcript_164773/g.528647  ORF Transcript_164773/g.528647 Transcript_164773/m.528647 type:complete len:252 (+) Transcript_164773:1345-2100(+)
MHANLVEASRDPEPQATSDEESCVEEVGPKTEEDELCVLHVLLVEAASGQALPIHSAQQIPGNAHQNTLHLRSHRACTARNNRPRVVQPIPQGHVHDRDDEAESEHRGDDGGPQFLLSDLFWYAEIPPQEVRGLQGVLVIQSDTAFHVGGDTNCDVVRLEHLRPDLQLLVVFHKHGLVQVGKRLFLLVHLLLGSRLAHAGVKGRRLEQPGRHPHAGRAETEFEHLHLRLCLRCDLIRKPEAFVLHAHGVEV